MSEREDRRTEVGRIGGRDPKFIDSLLPAIDLALRWFDAEVRDLANLPAEGPVLLVGNHSGGVFMPDYWALLREWVRERGADAPLHALGSDLLFSIPGPSQLARRIGTVPASPRKAAQLLEAGSTVVVYPGGDAEDYRPWRERNQIDLRGHVGFVRLALRHGVPVVPFVSHGSHEALIVMARGDELARSLRLDRLRINVLPVVLGPTGPTLLPVASPPLPSKVIVRVCPPLDWSSFGADDADDEEVVAACYGEIVDVMQTALDELVAEVPHPVRARVGSALGFDRLRRFRFDAAH